MRPCLRDVDAEAAVQPSAAEADEDATVDGGPRRAPAANAVRALAVLRPPQQLPQGLHDSHQQEVYINGSSCQGTEISEITCVLHAGECTDGKAGRCSYCTSSQDANHNMVPSDRAQAAQQLARMLWPATRLSAMHQRLSVIWSNVVGLRTARCLRFSSSVTPFISPASLPLRKPTPRLR